jgi:hypothetical protein
MILVRGFIGTAACAAASNKANAFRGTPQVRNRPPQPDAAMQQGQLIVCGNDPIGFSTAANNSDQIISHDHVAPAAQRTTEPRRRSRPI